MNNTGFHFEPGDVVHIYSLKEEGIVLKVRLDDRGEPLIDLQVDSLDKPYVARGFELMWLTTVDSRNRRAEGGSGGPGVRI